MEIGFAKKTMEKKNTSIFITNLPIDITIDELYEIFSKFGIIMDDMFTINTPRIKIYSLVGSCEALIVFLREESAQMAIKYMDSSIIRQNILISVEKAKFKSGGGGGGGNNTEMPLSIDPQTWKERMREMNRKLEWDCGGGDDEEVAAMAAAAVAATPSKGMESWKRILVIEGMFDSSSINPSIILDLKEDLLVECESKCGKVSSVKVFPMENSCVVKFLMENDALNALYLMDKRFFDGRQLKAKFYDGSFSLKERKKKKNVSIESDLNAIDDDDRLDKFGDWLEEEEEGK